MSVTPATSVEAEFRFWRVKRLFGALEASPPSGFAQAGFLSAFFLLDIFSWGLDTEILAFSQPTSRSYWLSVGLAIPVVKLLGPLVSYRCYRGAEPARFTDRFIALSCPIRVQVLTYLLLLLVPLSVASTFVASFFELPKETLFGGAGVGLFWLAFNIWHYTWLSVLMSRYSIGQRS